MRLMNPFVLVRTRGRVSIVTEKNGFVKIYKDEGRKRRAPKAPFLISFLPNGYILMVEIVCLAL